MEHVWVPYSCKLVWKLVERGGANRTKACFWTSLNSELMYCKVLTCEETSQVKGFDRIHLNPSGWENLLCNLRTQSLCWTLQRYIVIQHSLFKMNLICLPSEQTLKPKYQTSLLKNVSASLKVSFFVPGLLWYLWKLRNKLTIKYSFHVADNCTTVSTRALLWKTSWTGKTLFGKSSHWVCILTGYHLKFSCNTLICHVSSLDISIK